MVHQSELQSLKPSTLQSLKTSRFYSFCAKLFSPHAHTSSCLAFPAQCFSEESVPLSVWLVKGLCVRQVLRQLTNSKSFKTLASLAQDGEGALNWFWCRPLKWLENIHRWTRLNQWMYSMYSYVKGFKVEMPCWNLPPIRIIKSSTLFPLFHRNHSACRRWLKPSRYLWMWRMAVAVAWPLSSAKTWCVLFFLDAVSIQIQTYGIVLCSRHSLETELEKEEQGEIHPFNGNPKLGNSPADRRMRCTFLTCPNQSF